MDWLNYHHLLYFWTVAREGTIARACKKLYLTQPTISGQLRRLEKSLNVKLFDKVGRNLVLSETGRQVYRYADEIFTLGRELCENCQGGTRGHVLRLEVGIADVLPRWIVYRLLEPVLRHFKSVQLVCHDDKTDRLLSRLVLNELDVIFSDMPASPLVKARVHNHMLGESSVSFFAEPKLAAKCRRGFPRSLDGVPFILPMEGTALRRSLDEWFEQQKIQPAVHCEISDRDLFEILGDAGEGVFVIPTVLEQRIRRQFRVVSLGRVKAIRESFYAISAERKLKHPAVIAICETARKQFFK